MKKFKKKYKYMIAIIILFILVLLIAGTYLIVSNKNESCEIGKVYEKSSSCTCPDGYKFEDKLTWGKCPNVGMNDCPVTVRQCVSK